MNIENATQEHVTGARAGVNCRNPPPRLRIARLDFFLGRAGSPAYMRWRPFHDTPLSTAPARFLLAAAAHGHGGVAVDHRRSAARAAAPHAKPQPRPGPHHPAESRAHSQAEAGACPRARAPRRKPARPRSRVRRPAPPLPRAPVPYLPPASAPSRPQHGPPDRRRQGRPPEQPPRTGGQIDPAGPPRGVPIYTEADCVGARPPAKPGGARGHKRVDATVAQITTAKGPLYPALTTTGYYQRRDQSIANGGETIATVNGKGQTVVTAADFNRPGRLLRRRAGLPEPVLLGGAVRNRIAAAVLAERIAEGCNYQVAARHERPWPVRDGVFLPDAHTPSRTSACASRRWTCSKRAGQGSAGTGWRRAGPTVGLINVNRVQVQPRQPAARPARGALQAALSTSLRRRSAQALGVAYAARTACRQRPSVCAAPWSSGRFQHDPGGMPRQRAQALRPEVADRVKLARRRAQAPGRRGERPRTRPQTHRLRLPTIIYSETRHLAR